MTVERDERYEEVRRQLLERGYLQGRIERFVLRDLVRPERAWGRILRVAVKASVLGGPLLGAVLAGTAAAANRPLVVTADLPLLWLYFTPIAAIALFGLDLVAAGLTAALSRWRGVRPGDPARAALIVGIPTLLYLLVLWRHQAGAGDRWFDVIFLLAAGLATWFVARLAGLVSLSQIVSRTGTVPRRSRRWVTIAALVVFGLLAAGALLLGRPGRDAREADPFEPIPGNPGLLVVGVDGLDGALFRALESRGAVPNLKEMGEQGARYRMSRASGAQPPEVWTTIATGVPSAEHGVRSVDARRLPGVATPLRKESGPLPLLGALRFLLPARPVPTSGVTRRIRTVWEILGLRRPVLASGWWASWPAEGGGQSGEYVITDRVLAKLIADAPGDRDTLPATLYQRLANEFAADREAIRRSFEDAFPAELRKRAGRTLWDAFLIDTYLANVSARILSDAGVRAGFVYLPGLDILRNRLSTAGGEATRGLEEMLVGPDALQGYVVWLDSRVRMLAEAVPGARVVLIADPGRKGDAEDGFVLVGGDLVEPGCRGGELAPLDVAPLVLSLAGYPLSQEMAGVPPSSCLHIDLAALAQVGTYGRRPVPDAAPGSDYDAEMIERLKSLGYLN